MFWPDSVMRMRSWFLSVFVLVLSNVIESSVYAAEVDTLTEKKSEQYYYLDLHEGLLPIPSSLVLKASSLKPDSREQFRRYDVSYALPFWKPPIQKFSPDWNKYMNTQIRVGLVDEIDPTSPPGSGFYLETSFRVNQIDIHRYRVDQTKTDMTNISRYCIDRILVDKFYVLFQSDDCSLSSELTDGFVRRSEHMQ
jgi:hypothetical protein